MVNVFILLGNTSPHLLKEFPDPKGLLNNAISRSLGIGDLSQYVQYSCTEHAGVKVRTKTRPWWQFKGMEKSVPAELLFSMTSFHAESYCQSTLALHIWSRGSGFQEDRCRKVCCCCRLSQAQSKLFTLFSVMQKLVCNICMFHQGNIFVCAGNGNHWPK